MKAQKKVIYISGAISGVDRYYEAFETAEDDIYGCGCIPLSPAHWPNGLTDEQYMHLDLAMIDVADGVYFLPGSAGSVGSMLERDYCRYIGKPHSRFLADLLEMLEAPGNV